MSKAKQERETFGGISQIYDEARPSYPKILIDDIIAFSTVKKGDSVLDIGCGTGQATLLFAEQGFSVTGLDLSGEMIAVAKKKCVSFPQVDFKEGIFEEVEFSKESFDLIISAMAWHWIISEKRYEKVHLFLKKKAALALFWYTQVSKKSHFLKDAGAILEKYGGKNAGPTGPRIEVRVQDTLQELKSSPLFTDIHQKEYFEEILFSKGRYTNLVLSYGWVQMLSEKDKEELVTEFEELYKKYKEPLHIPYKFMLLLAKKKSD